jgi:4-hydroxyphenylpyruvate dioxygenase
LLFQEIPTSAATQMSAQVLTVSLVGTGDAVQGMNFAYLHLYVNDAPFWRDWFVEKLDFWPIAGEGLQPLGELAVYHDRILVLLSSNRSGRPEVQRFLQQYSEGIGDVAFHVQNLDAIVSQILRSRGELIQPVQVLSLGGYDWRWCQVKGWGSLVHTLIEDTATPALPFKPAAPPSPRFTGLRWSAVDHAVLNVPAGELSQAVTWYQEVLGFVPQQQFVIVTPRSGLRSIVLKHPHGNATLPINEPTSANSQVQEFIDLHQGAGIQHVALKTYNLVETIARLRHRGLSFLAVPDIYYQQLRSRDGYWHHAGDWRAIAQQQILVDWPPEEPQTRLLQTFTHPLFGQPTFFWEFIERQSRQTQTGLKCAEGFGEGNFQALFEAIEREQALRGSLE